jgi:hypothetical protein
LAISASMPGKPRFALSSDLKRAINSAAITDR